MSVVDISYAKQLAFVLGALSRLPFWLGRPIRLAVLSALLDQPYREPSYVW